MHIMAYSLVGFAGISNAATLTYQYTGNPLFADKEDSKIYTEVAIKNGLDPSQFAYTTISGLKYSVMIDESLLAAGTVRGQTVTAKDVEFRDGFVRPTNFINFRLTFDMLGKVIDWSYSDIDEIDGASSYPFGDSFEINFETSGFIEDYGDSYFAWSNQNPGTWEQMSNDLAPVPLPATLPLMLACAGSLALFSRRRGARRPS